MGLKQRWCGGGRAAVWGRGALFPERGAHVCVLGLGHSVSRETPVPLAFLPATS